MLVAIVLIVALLAGLLARVLGLPPMVGFLAAGFALTPLQHFFPAMESPDFQPLADAGITLLLFTIGLKLDLRTLMRPFVWAATCLHMVLVIALMTALLMGLKALGWAMLAELSLAQNMTIGFALSFSSTVFAVKVLEERGEMASLHGKTAIGILIMQDIFAVTYLSAMGDSWPSIVAPLVLLLIPARGLLIGLLKRCGHGELLVLAGFAMAYGTYGLFSAVGLKGDLGALFIGAVLAGSAKGNELVKSLLTIKDLLLIGFFLSIGQYGLPSGDAWLMALLLAALLLIKPILYFVLLSRFQLRAQTAMFTAMALNHYSEFGLIVVAIALQQGLLPGEWLVILALALSFSFVISSFINLYGDRLYSRLHKTLVRLQTANRVVEQQAIDIGSADIVVVGMGRLGSGAYDYLRDSYGERVLGFEESEKKVVEHVSKGRRVIVGDGSDRDLWQRLPQHQINKVILALNNHSETVLVTELLRECGFSGVIAAVAKFDDDLDELKAMGVIAFNFYTEAGAGFAEHVVKHLESEAVAKAC